MSPLPLQRAEILGYRLIDESAARIAAAVCDNLQGEIPRSFIFLNPHTVALAARDPVLHECLLHSEILCDGIGISLASFILRRRKISRVWGQDFFLAVSAELASRGRGRVFFLGGHDAFIGALVDKYHRQFPGLESVSYYVPPFKAEFDDQDIGEMLSRIRAFKPDIVWLGVGSPKQEKLLLRLQEARAAPCAAAIGAVFDFYSGRVHLGPKWIRDAGLLWAYRLLIEPKRLWRRTFVSAPHFMFRVFAQLVRP